MSNQPMFRQIHIGTLWFGHVSFRTWFGQCGAVLLLAQDCFLVPALSILSLSPSPKGKMLAANLTCVYGS